MTKLTIQLLASSIALVCGALSANEYAPKPTAPAPKASASVAKADSETLANGTKVVHTKRGSGAKPTAGDQVKVHYKGTLLDGTEFDSSYKRNAPATFPLGRVIPCWTQGLQTMAVGGKATLTCPPEAAYGARGAGTSVPPNATLNFEVELLEIVK